MAILTSNSEKVWIHYLVEPTDLYFFTFPLPSLRSNYLSLLWPFFPYIIAWCASNCFEQFYVLYPVFQMQGTQGNHNNGSNLSRTSSPQPLQNSDSTLSRILGSEVNSKHWFTPTTTPCLSSSQGSHVQRLTTTTSERVSFRQTNQTQELTLLPSAHMLTSHGTQYRPLPSLSSQRLSTRHVTRENRSTGPYRVSPGPVGSETKEKSTQRCKSSLQKSRSTKTRVNSEKERTKESLFLTRRSISVDLHHRWQ